nr:MAG TPA: hypothetical protein [Caudoviricetes sp.]
MYYYYKILARIFSGNKKEATLSRKIASLVARFFLAENQSGWQEV